MAEKNFAGITNIIGEGTEISGKLFVPGSIRVDCKIDGEVSISDQLTVGKTGFLKGTVKTKDAVIGGRMEGTLVVSNRIELQKSAKIKVDLVCKLLVIEEGVVFDGTCSMSSGQSQDKPYIQQKNMQ